MARNYTRLPSGLNEEDVFLPLGDKSFSLRQVLTVAIATGIWYYFGGFMGSLLFGNSAWGLLGFIWIFLGGFWIAFKKKEGKTYEQWFSEKLVYMIESKQYTLRDMRSYADDAEDAAWKEEDEPYGF